VAAGFLGLISFHAAATEPGAPSRTSAQSEVASETPGDLIGQPFNDELSLPPNRPIKSEADFKAYLSTVDNDTSPLAAFSEFEFAEFSNNLRFTDRGLAGFNASVFADLNVSETSGILALFDLPFSATALAGYSDSDGSNAALMQTRAAKGPAISTFSLRILGVRVNCQSHRSLIIRYLSQNNR